MNVLTLLTKIRGGTGEFSILKGRAVLERVGKISVELR